MARVTTRPWQDSVVNVSTSVTEPVPTTDAKNHLVVSSSADDGLIGALVKSAREYSEGYTSRAIPSQTFEYRLDHWPFGENEIRVPNPPMRQSSTHVTVTYLTSSGSTKTFGSSNYRVDYWSEPARIVLKSSQSWPSDTLEEGPAVTVSYEAGYSTGAGFHDPPEGLNSAIRLLVGHWYKNREGVEVSNLVPREVPFAVRALLDRYKVPFVP